jgi:hypothetical protein
MEQTKMTSYTASLKIKNYLSRSMGFPKLEAGLCAMTKEDLADSLAYNGLKVRELYT